MLGKPIATAATVAIGLVAACAVSLGAGRHSSHGPAPQAFSWLRPAPPPSGWNVARSTGGALAYPPGWTPIKTDPGTASVALLGSAGDIDAYLNATPRQGKETLANWTHFRPAHNKGEGNQDVRVVVVRLLSISLLTRDSSFPRKCRIHTAATGKSRPRTIDAICTSVSAYCTGSWPRRT